MILLWLAKIIGAAWIARLNAFFELILKFLAFCLKHWRIILPLVMLAYVLYQNNALRRDNAQIQAQFNNYKAEIAKNVQKRALELEFLAIQGKKDEASRQKAHNDALAQIMLSSAKSINNLKGEHEKDKAISERDISNWRERVRLEVANVAAAQRLPENDTTQFAETDGNAAAIRRENETLREAGAVCAADYNACHAYIENEQARLGVYE